MLDTAIKNAIAQVNADAAWPLVEAFSTMPRWKPEDVESSAHDIAKRLGDLGVPVELLEALLYLSSPTRLRSGPMARPTLPSRLPIR